MGRPMRWRPASASEGADDRVPGVLEGGHDRWHEVRHRAHDSRQHKAERDDESNQEPVAPDAMPAQRCALSSHLRLYNELG